MNCKMIKRLFTLLILAALCSCAHSPQGIQAYVHIDNTPLLALKDLNTPGTLTLVNENGYPYSVSKIVVSLEAKEGVSDVASMSLDGGETVALVNSGRKSIDKTFRVDMTITDDTLRIPLGIRMKDEISLSNRIRVSALKIVTDKGVIKLDCSSSPNLRTGVALRQRYQDGVDNCRIPGLVTTVKGTLLAMYDARRDADRDLQGDIDICYNRSTDGGRTWSEMMVALDMGEYGGLPQKYNGVSDGAMLVDTNTGTIFVAGLWMYGIHDPVTGEFVEGLTQESTAWNHQWRSFGSQPGYDIKQSSQFLIAKSTDDGLTWSEPVNITRQVKTESHWLMAPAPGAGIVLADGTLVFPAEGRDETGLQYSTIIYSQDGGDTWHAGTPAYTNANECMVVQLSDGSIMINSRERSNRNKVEGNGRMVATTSDLGQTWTIHPTSQNALIEPACQASLLKHGDMILFFNPSSISDRDNFTLKCSTDDGMTWPEERWIQFDCKEGNGYSCMSSIDDDTIGILYEGSGANMVFQQFDINELK